MAVQFGPLSAASVLSKPKDADGGIFVTFFWHECRIGSAVSSVMKGPAVYSYDTAFYRKPFPEYVFV